MEKKMVKICGITDEKEVLYLNTVNPDFMGMVVFFEKSKRNISIETADYLASKAENIKTVAVTVSPSVDDIKKINATCIDYLQLHGAVSDEEFDASEKKVIRAFNSFDKDEIKKYLNSDKVYGLLFDAASPGSGKTFDWNMLKEIIDELDIKSSGKKIFLAGGLTPENVSLAVESNTKVDVFDVSSGVENDNGIGKDFNKINAFINNVRK